MNAFTIPEKSVMANARPPVPANHKSGDHWRNLPITNAKQGEADRIARLKLMKSKI